MPLALERIMGTYKALAGCASARHSDLEGDGISVLIFVIKEDRLQTRTAEVQLARPLTRVMMMLYSIPREREINAFKHKL